VGGFSPERKQIGNVKSVRGNRKEIDLFKKKKKKKDVKVKRGKEGRSHAKCANT